MSIDVKTRKSVHILRRRIDADHVELVCGRIGTKDDLPERRARMCPDCLAADRFERSG